MTFAREVWKAIRFRLAISIALAALYIVVSMGNSRGLEVTYPIITIPNLPQALDGLKVAQITDFHSSNTRQGQQEALDAVASAKPDIIVLTGDFIDGYNPNLQNCLDLAQGLAAIAPVYRVRGNHEYYENGIFTAKFDTEMAAAGVTLLENDAIVLQKDGCSYLLAGLDDVFRSDGDLRRDLMNEEVFDYQVETGFVDQLKPRIPQGKYSLRLLLSHRPYYWQQWVAAGFNAALCGHLHGHQIRVPQVGGILLNASRYFPQADAGLYTLDGIQVYISRGMAWSSSLRSIRLNNHPELDIVEFRSK
jgi:uncharacterized protein